MHHQEKGYYTKLQTHICFGREQLQMLHMGQIEQLQMLQLQKREEAEPCCYLKKGYLHQATKLTFALGKSSCKCFTWLQMLQLIGGRAGYLHQAMNSPSVNSCKCFTWASTMCVGASLLYCIMAVQYSARVCSMAQCSFLFLNKRTGLPRKSVFLR